jgi:hypothetical protein
VDPVSRARLKSQPRRLAAHRAESPRGPGPGARVSRDQRPAQELTVRTWSATASAAGAESYSRYFVGTLLPELRKLAGFEGACLLRRDLSEDGAVELTAHTFWTSPDAIRAFAGNGITVAIVEPEARVMLLDFDRTATHSGVVTEARG